MRSDKLDKIIIQSVLSTLCAILTLCVIAFTVANLLFPAVLIKVSYDLGNDVGAMGYAERAYKNTGNVYYIAYATEVAIGLDEYSDVERYAEEFISNGDAFLEYCKGEDELAGLGEGAYRQRVFGQLVLAEYYQGKTEEAYEHAAQSLDGGFPRNNAYVALFIGAMQKWDKPLVDKLVNEMKEMTPNKEDDATYLSEILGAYEKLLQTP